MEVDARQTLTAMNWRQGAILSLEDGHRFLSDNIEGSEDSLFIVAPYSCAVVNGDFEQSEPWVELFRFTPTDENRELQYSRHARLLQLAINTPGGIQFYTANIHDRHFIAHEQLLVAPPSTQTTLDDDQIKIFESWIVKRYRRNVFPSAFDQRTRPVRNWLKKFLSKAYRRSDDNLSGLLGIHIKLDPLKDELEDLSDPYELSVYLLVTEHTAANLSEDLITIRRELEERYTACEGIELEQSVIVSESALLVSEFKDMYRLDDYDYFSLDDGSELIDP